MKKKTLGLLAAVLSVCMLAGCGAKDAGDGTGTSTGAGTESTALKDMDVDKYVTLGEYKGLEVSVDTVEVDEDEWILWSIMYIMETLPQRTAESWIVPWRPEIP